MKNIVTAYKRTLVGKGSQLAAALEDSPAAAKRVYEDTTARFDATYPAGDRQWFENWSDARDLGRLVPSVVLEMSAADAAFLIGLQENPPTPNAALQRAFARFKERA